MKHFILTTLVTFFISTVSFSQSNLVVYSNDGVNFTLEVNGVQQNETPTTNVKVEGIAQEFISVRILFADGKTPALKKSFPLTKNNEVSAQLVLNKKGLYKLRYMGETPIGSSASPANQTVIRYGEEPVAISNNAPVASPSTPIENTPMGSTSSTSTTVTTTTVNNGVPNTSENINMNVNIGGQSVGISTSMTGMESSSTTTVTETTTINTSSSSTINSAPQTNVPTQTIGAETVSTGGCDAPMPSGELNSALASMEAKSFEDSKITLAKQFTKANCLSADQIKSVMQKFTFEDNKLEYAKFAYDYCLDQPSYYKVNDAFQFELTIDELDEYLESK